MDIIIIFILSHHSCSRNFTLFCCFPMTMVYRSYLSTVYLIFLFLESFRIYWCCCRKANKICLIFCFREILKSLTLLILQSLTVLWGHSGEVVSWCRSITLIRWIVISDFLWQCTSVSIWQTCLPGHFGKFIKL